MSHWTSKWLTNLLMRIRFAVARFSSFSKRAFVSKSIRLSFSAKWKTSWKLFVDVNSMMIMLMSRLKICCMKNSINQKAMNLIWRIRLISVSSLQLVARNVVTVNYVDAWVKWWMIFIKCYLEILYRRFSKHLHMLKPRSHAR